MWENELRKWIGDKRKKLTLKRACRQRYIEPIICEVSILRVTKRRSGKIPFDRAEVSRKNAPDDREHGFTLVELLVVLAILGLLIALVAPAMIRQLGSAKHKIAQQSIERLSGVLDLYRLDVGDYPATAQGLAALNDNAGNMSGWNGPYLKDADGIVDPWGHPFQYRYPSQRAKHAFDILSLGADGKPGGEGENADVLNR